MVDVVEKNIEEKEIGRFHYNTPSSYISLVDKLCEPTFMRRAIIDFGLKHGGSIFNLDAIQSLEYHYNNTKYTFRKLRLSGEHRFGDGGETEIQEHLMRNDTLILLSKDFKSYYTYSDDSADFELESRKETYLLEEDELGRYILEELKK
ncbi:MAG TPA: hypothetical protein VJK51_03855 [Candidatus Nanoarchaeia archaeon]|nr:hypothetical protein [Candidatus Nanoarchaeia archaeon]